MNSSLRRIRRLLSLEKQTVGARPTSAPAPSGPQRPGTDRGHQRHSHYGPRQSF